MLSLLEIQNIAVIECAAISFDKGFNILTGETGAGKSIVIDAISAIIGERAYRDMIRTGTNKASVRAVFTDVPELSWFSDNGVPYDPLAKADPDTTLSIEDREIGGLGIYMVKKSMDELTYEYQNGQNILKIKKRI